MFDSALLTKDVLVTVIDNKTYTVTKEHANYNALMNAFKEKDSDKFIELYNPVDIVQKFTNQNPDLASGIEVLNDVVYYNKQPLHNAITENIISLLKNGFDFQPMVKFLTNLMENPSKNSVDQLYNFLSQHRLTITEDGCFLAYKSVKSNYLDKYSGKYHNTVGAIMTMPRNQVDDNTNNHCSYGFHVGGLAYSGPNGWYHNNGDKIMIVKVNPKDVVSVPNDNNYQKIRVCQYEVVGEFVEELKSPVFSGNVGDTYKNPDNYVEDDTEVDYQEDILPDDMLIGWEYTFKYEGKQRHVCVENIDTVSVLCLLISPEQNSGQYRRFKLDGITDIEEI